MSWTDERVEQLKKLWAQGYSASQIAKELGNTTRNAVIGKIHRLNLVARQSPKTTPPLLSSASTFKQKPLAGIGAKLPPSKPSEYMAPSVAFASITPAAAAYDQAEFNPSSSYGTGTKLEAHNPFKNTRSQCQWPVGDPRSPGFHFCGGPIQEGFSYCGEHARMAYQPVQKKRISMGNTNLHDAGTPDEREINVRF
ncbi:MAG: GcrA family cell cycle regulator [Bdellovibrionales bacterium]